MSDGKHSNPAQILPPSALRLYAIVGFAIATIGNIIAAAGHFETFRQFFYKMLGLHYLQITQPWVITAFLLICIAGYLLMAFWLFMRFVAERGWIARAGFVALVIIGAVGSTIMYVLSMPPNSKELSTQLIKQANEFSRHMLSYQADNGGIRFAQSAMSNDTQVWTTAQSLYGVLTATDDVMHRRDSIRKAFDYIERMQLKSPNEGWAYADALNWGITEIAGWTTLAYVASLRPPILDILWDKTASQPVQRIQRNLDLLALRQHASGAWGPNKETDNAKHVRTYSTAMALWAFAEARRVPSVREKMGTKYDQNISGGIHWILNEYVKTEGMSGWWPNPNTKPEIHSFPGLTAQILYVLVRAQKEFEFLQVHPQYLGAKSTFIQTAVGEINDAESLLVRDVSVNQRQHDSDRYLPGAPFTAEQSTFLWYPWSFVLANELRQDTTLTEADRGRALRFFTALLRRNKEFVRFVQRDPVLYPMAEGLFAIGAYLRSQPI